VLNVVSTNTADDLIHIAPGVWGPESVGAIASIRPSQKVAGPIPDEVTRLFPIDLSFQPHYDCEVDSASNRNKYQESSWG
jgi:hypothetical protein